MPSVVEELNQLLARERGQVEALKAFLDDMDETDPDIAESGADVLQTAGWTCSGLYHRITQLHGTPALDATDLEARMCDQPDPDSKLKLICREHRNDVSLAKSILKRDDLDDTTRDFLKDVLNAHQDTARWCEATLAQFEQGTQAVDWNATRRPD